MIILDYNDKRPIYEQICERFQTLILTGALEADEKLPSVRSLAVDLSINPNTIQRAYSELEHAGFIYSVKGRGNFVKANDSLLLLKEKKLKDDLRNVLISCKKNGLSEACVTSCVQEIFHSDDTHGGEARNYD